MKQLQMYCGLLFLFTIANGFFLRNSHQSQNTLFFNDASKYLKIVNQNV